MGTLRNIRLLASRRRQEQNDEYGWLAPYIRVDDDRTNRTEKDDLEDEAASLSRYDMFVRGMTDLEIAAVLEVHNSIQKWRARNCLPLNGVRSSGPADAIAHIERRALYEQGFSDEQIADQLGMRTQAITRWRKRAGLSGHHDLDGAGQISV